MNIIFTKLPTTDGIIKISLDGGQSFTDYSIANIPEDGISLSDDQDYEKIRIKGPANVLKNLSIVSSVKVEGASGSSGGSVKLYAFYNATCWLYAYTFSETLKDGDKVFYGEGGDSANELHLGTIATGYINSQGDISTIDNGFVIIDSQCTYIDKYTIFTRVNEKDIELTVNSSGEGSNSGSNSCIDYVWQVYSNTDTNIEVIGYNYTDYINNNLNSIRIPSGTYKIVSVETSSSYHGSDVYEDVYWYEFIKEVLNDVDTVGVTYDENEKIITISDNYSITDDCNSVDDSREGLFFLQKV